MSKVISFRLDLNNTREARAYLYLLTKQKEGYSTREIITLALVDQEENNTKLKSCLEHHNLSEITVRFEQLSALLSRYADTTESREASEKDRGLPASLTTSIKKNAKPGLTLE